MATTDSTNKPRAFYPDYMENAPVPAIEPGWDRGPEKKWSVGHKVSRAILVGVGFGAAALLLAYARRRHGGAT